MTANGEIREAMQRAVALYGSEHKLAVAVGVTQAAISKAKRLQRVSVALALAVHKATKGKVSASELRPDVWRKPKDVPIER